MKMTDLRKAAEMALEVMEYNRANGTPNMGAAIEALRQALAQPEQEFVGACVTCGAPKGEWLVDAVNISQERVDETAKREHEPVAIVNEGMGGIEWLYKPLPDDTLLYAAPQKREWVGLTDEDLKPLCNQWKIMYGGYVDDFARAIEAKLKEKNT